MLARTVLTPSSSPSSQIAPERICAGPSGPLARFQQPHPATFGTRIIGNVTAKEDLCK